MSRIVRAEFLSYYNAPRNSDKLFNVFVIEDDGTFRCVSEYGRRGNNLIRDTLCTKATRDLAESKLRQKLAAKRNHRETPYTDELLGYNYSPLAREHGFAGTQGENQTLSRSRQPLSFNEAVRAKTNVIEFPSKPSQEKSEKPAKTGILNQEQMNSLEI